MGTLVVCVAVPTGGLLAPSLPRIHGWVVNAALLCLSIYFLHLFGMGWSELSQTNCKSCEIWAKCKNGNNVNHFFDQSECEQNNKNETVSLLQPVLINHENNVEDQGECRRQRIKTFFEKRIKR